MTAINESEWRALIVLYAQFKEFAIFFEQHDPAQKMYLQPLVQMRNSYDHLVKALPYLILQDDPKKRGSEYYATAIANSTRHMYRAFLDCADLAFQMAKIEIEDLVADFSLPCLCTVLPTYYPQWAPRIDALCAEMAALRTKKDGDLKRTPDDIIDEAERFAKTIKEIQDIRKDVRSRLPALQEFTTKEQRDKQVSERSQTKAQLRIGVIVGLATTAILGVVALAWNYFCPGS
jgi:hypothetical protein